MKIPRKYHLLRFIAFMLKLLAWLVLLAGILATAAGLTIAAEGLNRTLALWQVARLAAVVAGPVLGLIWFVQLYAFGSILSLLINVEENTRALAVSGATKPASGE